MVTIKSVVSAVQHSVGEERIAFEDKDRLSAAPPRCSSSAAVGVGVALGCEESRRKSHLVYAAVRRCFPPSALDGNWERVSILCLTSRCQSLVDSIVMFRLGTRQHIARAES